MLQPDHRDLLCHARKYVHHNHAMAFRFLCSSCNESCRERSDGQAHVDRSAKYAYIRFHVLACMLVTTLPHQQHLLHTQVAVCEYSVTDPLVASFKEVSTHIVIYHSTLDGAKQLYRHFLRLPDGTILELFGNGGEQVQGADMMELL